MVSTIEKIGMGAFDLRRIIEKGAIPPRRVNLCCWSADCLGG
jgi:hypothetical protein